MPILTSPRALIAPIAPVAVHPYDPAQRITAAAIRRDTSRSVEGGMIPVYMSTASEDRHGSTIRRDAWRLDSFNANPVMQWAHISWIPTVGNAFDLKADGKGWVANLKFATNAWSRFGGANLAQLLEDLMTDDMLHAVSPGFFPHAMVERKATAMPQFLDPENLEYTDVELTEISPCNVPSNREALQKSLQRGAVTENGLTALIQLGVLPGIFDDSPITLLSRQRQQERIMPITAEVFRSRIAETLKRCCGCEPERDTKPDTITADQKANEVSLLTETAATFLATLDVAMRGWKATLPTQRNLYTNIVVDAMYRLEGFIWRAKEWYDSDLAITVPDISVQEIQQVVKGASVVPTQRAHHAGGVIAGVAVRAKFMELLRCCGCDVYADPPPDLPEDEAARALEVSLMQDIADDALQTIETGMRAWKTAQTPRFRESVSYWILNAMSTYDLCVRWAKDWYRVDILGAPAVDLADVARALDGVTLADAFRRMAGPFEFASTQVNLPADVAEQVLAFGSTLIPDEALAKKGREPDVHITVKYGIDPSVDAASVMDAIKNSDSIKEMAANGGTMTLGATSAFDSDPDYDVVYVTVDSPDLVLLNQVISDALPVTDTQQAKSRPATDAEIAAAAAMPETAMGAVTLDNGVVVMGDKATDPAYVPHVALAYVAKGEGTTYAGDETLAGTEITFDSITFSDTDGNETDIPLAGGGLSSADVTNAARSSRRLLYIRIGAVFAKKNLDKIDQIIALAQDLRSAANKPALDDVPAEETTADEQKSAPFRIRIQSGDTSRAPGGISHNKRQAATGASRNRREESPTRQGDSLYVRLLND